MHVPPPLGIADCTLEDLQLSFAYRHLVFRTVYRDVCRTRPRTAGNSCGLSFRARSDLLHLWDEAPPRTPTWRSGTFHTYFPERGNRHRDITPGWSTRARDGREGREETRVKTLRSRGSRLPTIALPDGEFLASSATSKACLQKGVRTDRLADWPYRAGYSDSPSMENRRQRSVCT